MSHDLRRCKRCERDLPLTDEFYRPVRDIYYNRMCRKCSSRQQRERSKDDPAAKETRRRLAREYKKRVQADPDRRRRRNETERMAYRLRHERQGRDLDMIKAKRVKDKPVESQRVDVAPLREAVMRRLELDGLTMSDAALRCGYVSGNGRKGVEITQLKRNLGLVPTHSHGYTGCVAELRWETAAHIARSLDIDPQEVGL